MPHLVHPLWDKCSVNPKMEEGLEYWLEFSMDHNLGLLKDRFVAFLKVLPSEVMSGHFRWDSH